MFDDTKSQYSLEEVKKIAIKFLNDQHNLVDFCQEHNLTYSYVINFRNNKVAKNNTKIVTKICKIMGYDIEETPYFNVKKLK